MPTVAEEAAKAEARGLTEPPTPIPAPAAPVAAPPAATEPAPSPYYPPATVPAGPVVRSNRGLGVLLGILGGILLAIVYVALPFILWGSHNGEDIAAHFVEQLSRWSFWLPFGTFVVLFVLYAVIVNRAGLTVWLLGSLIVAGAVYFAYNLGLALDVFGFQIPWGSADLNAVLLQNLLIAIIVAAVAREIAVWLGAILGARGRRLKEVNREARAAFEAQRAGA